MRIKHLILVLAAVALITTGTPGQTFLHIPDNMPAVGTCNVIPYGQSATFSAGYTYIGRVPASFMDPINLRVDDIAFTPCAPGGTWSAGGAGSTGEIAGAGSGGELVALDIGDGDRSAGEERRDREPVLRVADGRPEYLPERESTEAEMEREPPVDGGGNGHRADLASWWHTGMAGGAQPFRVGTRARPA